MSLRGFHALARRLGVSVVLPDGSSVLGLFDRHTKAEHLTGKDYAPALVGRPSVLLETTPLLKVDTPLTVQGRAYHVGDMAQTGDAALTRYFLRLPS